MCGIAGYLRKEPGSPATGAVLLEMLRALGVRGPDSAGVALFGPPSGEWIFRVKAGETEADAALVERLVAEAGRHAEVTGHSVTGASLRLRVRGSQAQEGVNRLVAA